jgi:tripartite-type tricarboxylate transporter receptor subunit TctC
MLRGKDLWKMLFAVPFVLCAALAFAQDYPTRAITFVNPYAAGSPAEIPIRMFSDHVRSAWGQAIISENRPGAGGRIGLAAVAKANPDGYTMIYTGAASMSQLPLMFKDLPYDPLTEFVPVTTVMEYVTMLVSNAEVPAKTIEEFIAYAKAHPGKLNYGAIQRNSSMLAMEALNLEGGIKLNEVPYAGFSEYALGLIRNDVQIIPASIGGAVKAGVDSGKLRPLLVFGSRRFSAYPDVPSATERNLNLPSFGVVGIFAPKGTPQSVIDKVSAEWGRFAQDPAPQKATLQGAGALISSSTPEAFRKQIQNEYRVWSSVANAVGLKPE